MKLLLKKYLRPRRLVSRFSLLVLLPVLFLQVIISVLIIERYYDGVTTQLNQNTIFELQHLPQKTMETRGFTFNQYPKIEKNTFGWFDVSGRYILRNFQDAYGDQVKIDRKNYVKTIIQLSPELQLSGHASLFAPRNVHQILINIFAFAVFFSLIAIYFIRLQVRAMLELSKAAHSFGKGKEVNYVPRGADEVRIAGRAFLLMRDRILRQRQQRNLILSGVSHDLRTPLTRMKLALTNADEETQRNICSDIDDLEALVTSFLDYASNDGHEISQDVYIPDFINEISKNYSKLKLLDIEKITVNIRPFMLKRAFENLFNNAERYSDSYTLAAKSIDNYLYFYLDDDGPGIAEEEYNNALTAFYRLDNDRNQNQGPHAGLGLAIASDIIRIHGGEIQLDKSPQNGLRVTLNIDLDNN